MKDSPHPQKATQVAWRIADWSKDLGGVSRAQIYEWFKEGKLESIKVGGLRLITTSPQDFVAQQLNKTAAA